MLKVMEGYRRWLGETSKNGFIEWVCCNEGCYPQIFIKSKVITDMKIAHISPMEDVGRGLPDMYVVYGPYYHDTDKEWKKEMYFVGVPHGEGYMEKVEAFIGREIW